MVAKSTIPQPILDIYELAVRIRKDTCERVAADLNGLRFTSPEKVWCEVIDRRRKDGSCTTLSTAGKQLVRLASDEMRPFIKRATKRLCKAVQQLGEFRPEYAEQRNIVTAAEAREWGLGRSELVYSMWEPTAAAVERLAELRSEVFVKLVELEALFTDYPDALSRVVAVAKKIAGHVLKPVDAKRVVGWLEGVQAGG